MSSSDALKIGADLSLTVFILSLVFMIAGVFTTLHYRFAASNVTQVTELVNEYAIYENHVVSGDTVQSLIEKYSSEIFVRVETTKIPSGIFGDELNDCKNLDSEYFVNPVNQFYCTIIRGADNAILGMNFEQENVTLSNEEAQSAITDCNNKMNEG